MALQITHTDTVQDFEDPALQLAFAQFGATAVVAGVPFVFVTGFANDGFSAFYVAGDGTLINTANVTDNATLELDAAWGITAANVAGTPYVFVAGTADDGVSVFSVAPNGALTNVANVTDDATLELFGANNLTTAVVAGTTYLFVSGLNDNGVSVFSVAASGALTNVANVNDNATLELAGAAPMATAVISGTTYLFVAGAFDDGVSVFSVAASGALTNVANVTDDAVLQLDGPEAMTTAVVAGSTYLFVTGGTDDGISVFRVGLNGALANVANVHDDATLLLSGARGLTTALIDGTTYLFVAGVEDDGVNVFSVAPSGLLTHVSNIADSSIAALNGAQATMTVNIDGTTHLVVVGRSQSAVSVFSVTDPPPVITSNGGGDSATISVAENTVAVTAVTATDPGNAVGPAFSISGGDDASRFEISPFNGVLSFVTAPDFEAPTDADLNNSYIVRVRAFDGVRVDIQTITITVGDVASGDPREIGLDGVLWRHTDGTVAVANHNLGVLSTQWQIAGAADFDADGDSDVLLRRSDGTTGTWEFAGRSPVASHLLPTVATAWQVAGTGDFDRDGDADILWRHSGGDVVTWEMQGGAFVVNHNLANVASTWQIAGTGDFDHDGDADILWRHQDGDVVTWEMEGGAFVASHSLASVGSSWQIAGTGDFDHDGDADILWRHQDGDVVTWEMEGGAMVMNHTIATAGTAWHIAGAHDFDRDGDADILWRHDDGNVVTWEMESGALVTNHNFGVVPTAWHIERTGEFGLG